MNLIGLLFDNSQAIKNEKTLYVRSSRLKHAMPIIETIEKSLGNNLYVLSNTTNEIQEIIPKSNIILYDEDLISDINQDIINVLKTHNFSQIIYSGWEFPYFADVQFGNIYDFLFDNISNEKEIPIYYVNIYYSLYKTERMKDMPFPENLFPQLSKEDALNFHQLAKKIPTGGKIVEIGSCCGGSVSVMGLASKESVQLFSIDPSHHNEFYRTMVNHKLLTKVTPLSMLSSQAINVWRHMHAKEDRQIDLLFIDGDHSYEGCKFDIVAWRDLVKPGGWIILHDYCEQYPGVIRACEEEMIHNKEYIKTGVF